jgi:geranylgeranyl diphosphate synthase, type I
VGCSERTTHAPVQSLTDRIVETWIAAGVEPRYLEAMRSALVPEQPVLNAALEIPLPILSLPGLCCEAAGGIARRAEAVTAAWLLFYTAGHFLDNVADEVVVQEVRPSGGPGTTINIATGLIASANIILNKLEGSGISHEAACAIRGDFYHSMLKACTGQHADLTIVKPTLEQCWETAEAISGAVFAVACRAGARLATDDLGGIDLFGQFGHHLGMLLQIGDDISGLWPKGSTPSDLLAGHRWTLPVAYAMAVTPPAIHNHLDTCLLIAPTDQGSEVEARNQIIESGAVLYLAAEAARHHNQARAMLTRAAGDSPARDALLALLHKATPLGVSRLSDCATRDVTAPPHFAG